MFGTVHMDFWVFGFDIEFGSRVNRPDRLQLSEFYELVFKTAKTSGAANTDGQQRFHVLTCLAGLIRS